MPVTSVSRVNDNFSQNDACTCPTPVRQPVRVYREL